MQQYLVTIIDPAAVSTEYPQGYTKTFQERVSRSGLALDRALTSFLRHGGYGPNINATCRYRDFQVTIRRID